MIPPDTSILTAAHALVHGDRGEAYDHPAVDYRRTADIFAMLTGIELTPEEGVLFMLAVKLSRLARGVQADFPPCELRDTVVDAAGYLECYWAAVTYDD